MLNYDRTCSQKAEVIDKRSVTRVRRNVDHAPAAYRYLLVPRVTQKVWVMENKLLSPSTVAVLNVEHTSLIWSWALIRPPLSISK